MQKAARRIWVLIACTMAGGIHAQEEMSAERMQLLKEVTDVMTNQASHDAARAAGAERSLLCGSCHGKDGNSLKPEIPNLAGQNPAYLLEQIENFASGRRKNFVMQSLAANFSRTDKVNLAIYYASMPVQPTTVDAALARDGKRIFDSVCYLCHGHDGKGEAGYARIAGQKPLYVANTLRRYRANARGMVDSDEIKRTNGRMEQVTQNLSDADVDALAQYVASLR